MSQIELSASERRTHRADAHALKPVVIIGSGGLSESVQQEVDAALNAHGLIKIRVASDSREEREAMHHKLADALGAARVQHIGKLLVLWRPIPEKEAEPTDESRRPGPRMVKVVKYSRRGGQRPQVRRLTVLGNERVSAGGKVKRARVRRKSVKKGRSL